MKITTLILAAISLAGCTTLKEHSDYDGASEWRKQPNGYYQRTLSTGHVQQWSPSHGYNFGTGKFPQPK